MTEITAGLGGISKPQGTKPQIQYHTQLPPGVFLNEVLGDEWDERTCLTSTSTV